MRIELQKASRLFVAAGCVLVAMSTTCIRAFAGDGGKTPTVQNNVKLEIQIAGLGTDGAKVTIKPAHAGCQFKAIEKPIPKGSKGDVFKLEPISVTASSTSADRDCSFEITVTEPGHEPKTYRRGLRLAVPAAGSSEAPSRTLKCYLPAIAVASKDDGRGKTRR